MTSELETLRSLADRVHAPAFEALEEVARRRTRRTAVATTLGCVCAVVITVVGIAVATAGDDRSTPDPVIPPTPTPTVTSAPTPTPTEAPTHASETSMTPAEVVAAEDAQLMMAGISADDPDFRVAVWQATCHWCPKSRDARFKPSFRTLAITADSFATAVYRRAPFDTGLEHVESVGPGLLLVVDDSNGYEWLVRDDGTVTALDRDFDEIPAADPRLWFVCLDNTGRTGPGGQATPFDSQPTWCALDPKADTVHIWRGPWAGTVDDSWSMVHPGAGVVPWGVRAPTTGPGQPPDADPHLVAWWGSDGPRHHEDLGPATVGREIRNSPPGTMSMWSWVQGARIVRVFTSSDGGESWATTDLDIPFRPPYFLDLFWTPAGDLVGRQDDAFYPDGSPEEGDGLRLWRADFVDGGSFVVVLERRTGNRISTYDPPFTVRGDRLWASRLWSDDDGLTWNEVTPWRP